MWAFQGDLGPDATIVTPLQAQLVASPHRIPSPGQEPKQELGKRLNERPTELVDCVEQRSLDGLLDRVTSWREGNELVLSFIDPFS